MIVTGEDLPAAHSIRARALIVPIRVGDVDQGRLTAAQEAARRGLYEHALAGFVMWLAGRYEQVVGRWRELAAAYRAGLAAEIEILALYLAEADIEVPAEVLAHLDAEGTTGIGTAAAPLTRRMARVLLGTLAEQAEQQRGADPVRLFVETIAEALASGRAHVLDAATLRPPARHAALLGFRKRALISGGIETESWEAGGEHVGWSDGEHLYLNPPVAYAAVGRLLNEQGTELPKRPATLWGELHAAGWLKLTSPSKGQNRSTYKKKIAGIAKDVLALCLDEVIQACEEPDIHDVPLAAE